MEDPKETLASLLPETVAGWTAAPAEDQVFDPETIFDYIDGAGEVYRSYNFKLLLSRRYRRDGAGDLVADLFDMGSSRDAFGVFTHDLDGEDVGLGQGSNYKGGLLSFWRDRYFVSLYAEEETTEAKAALLAVGAIVAGTVGRDGLEPDLMEVIPAQFRNPGPVRYFHTHHVLNYHFFVAAENILNLDAGTEAVLAGRAAPVSTTPAGGGVLLAVRYPSAEAAAAAFAAFLRAYMPDARPGVGPPESTRLVQTEDGRWTGGFALGEILVLAFQETSADETLDALSRVSEAFERMR